MQITLSPETGAQLGRDLSATFRNFIAEHGNEARKNTAKPRKLDSDFFKGQFQPSFFDLATQKDGAELQEKSFTSKFWNLVYKAVPQELIEKALAPLNTPPKQIVDDPKKAKIIVTGDADGFATFLKVNPNGDDIKVNEIRFDRGGCGANIAQVIKNFDEARPIYVALHGSGEVGNLQESFLNRDGIDPVIVRSKQDLNLHPCLMYNDGRQAKDDEFWMVSATKPFSKEELNNYTKKIEELIKANKASALILSVVPPAGSSDNFFQKLAKLGSENQSIVVFNPQEYDYNKAPGAIKALLESGNLDIAKPNLNEFYKFLNSTDIDIASAVPDLAKIFEQIEHDKSVTEKSMRKQDEFTKYIRSKIQQKDYKESIKLARALLKKTKIKILLISMDENGLLLVTPQRAAFAKPPQLETNEKVESSSGAGDSGIAKFTTDLVNKLKSKGKTELKKALTKLKQNISDNELVNLAKAFVRTATTTVLKAGNQLVTSKDHKKLENRKIDAGLVV